MLRRWFDEVWNRGAEAAIDALFAPDGRIHGLGEAGVVAEGPAGFKPFWAQLCATFPERHFVVEDSVKSGDKVAIRWRARLLHGGNALGPEATGEEIEVTGMSFVRVRDGRILEGWNNWDSLTMATRINALQPIKPLMPTR
jgi:ketosteroid isomerase-like protein